MNGKPQEYKYDNFVQAVFRVIKHEDGDLSVVQSRVHAAFHCGLKYYVISDDKDVAKFQVLEESYVSDTHEKAIQRFIERTNYEIKELETDRKLIKELGELNQ